MSISLIRSRCATDVAACNHSWLLWLSDLSKYSIWSVVVLCNAAINLVSCGIVVPRFASVSRTSWSLSNCASTRTLTSPVCPPQAPQSKPAACKLLVLWLPWPTNNTSGANSVSSIACKIPIANSALSFTVRICLSFVSSQLSWWLRLFTGCASAWPENEFLSNLNTYNQPMVSTIENADGAACDQFCQRACLFNWVCWLCLASTSVTRMTGLSSPGNCGLASELAWGWYSRGKPKKPAKPSVCICGSCFSNARRITSERTSIQNAACNLACSIASFGLSINCWFSCFW